MSDDLAWTKDYDFYNPIIDPNKMDSRFTVSDEPEFQLLDCPQHGNRYHAFTKAPMKRVEGAKNMFRIKIQVSKQISHFDFGISRVVNNYHSKLGQGNFDFTIWQNGRFCKLGKYLKTIGKPNHQYQGYKNTELFIDFNQGKIRVIIAGKDQGILVENDEQLKSGLEFYFFVRSEPQNRFRLYKAPQAPPQEIQNEEEENKNEEGEVDDTDQNLVPKMLGLDEEGSFKKNLNGLLKLHQTPSEKISMQNLVLKKVIQNTDQYLELCKQIKQLNNEAVLKMTDFKIVRSLFESSINCELQNFENSQDIVVKKNYLIMKDQIFESLIHDVIEKMDLNADEKLEEEQNASDELKESLYLVRTKQNQVLNANISNKITQYPASQESIMLEFNEKEKRKSKVMEIVKNLMKINSVEFQSITGQKQTKQNDQFTKQIGKAIVNSLKEANTDKEALIASQDYIKQVKSFADELGFDDY